MLVHKLLFGTCPSVLNTVVSSFQGVIVVYTEVSSFQEVGIEVYRGIFISGGWNRGVPLYTEVFQEVGIEGFHCIQRYLHFRVLE